MAYSDIIRYLPYYQENIKVLFLFLKLPHNDDLKKFIQVTSYT